MKRPRIPQSAVLPVRRGPDGITVCLVTSLNKKRWILPKGIIDPGETAEETALKEALAEAGVKGRIVGEPLGRFEDSKWGATIDVTVLLMEVDDCMDHWAESHLRERRFVSLTEAKDLVKKRAVKKILKRARTRLAGWAPDRE